MQLIQPRLKTPAQPVYSWLDHPAGVARPNLNQTELDLQRSPQHAPVSHHFSPQTVLNNIELALDLNGSLAIVSGLGHNNKAVPRMAASRLLNGHINNDD